MSRSASISLGSRRLSYFLAGGTGGSDLFLYIRSGNGWRQILRSWGQSLVLCAQAVGPPCPLPTGSERGSGGTHGWPDLKLWVHESVNEGNQWVYRFDGTVYKPVACRHVLYDENWKPSSTPCIGQNWRASEGTKVDVPSDLAATLHRDVDQFDAGCRWWPPEHRYDEAEWFDLNRSQRALLVRPCLRAGPRDPDLLWLYIRRGDVWHRIFKGFGHSLAVCAEADPPCPAPRGSEHRATRTKGWPDLSLWGRNGTRRVVYRFDGNVYKALVCTDVKTSNPEGKLFSEPRYSPCPSGWRASEP
jgi:hypothetical protein